MFIFIEFVISLNSCGLDKNKKSILFEKKKYCLERNQIRQLFVNKIPKRIIMKKLWLFILYTIFFMACAEQEVPDVENYTIKFGSECGWCAGQEYIYISGSKIDYERNIPCGGNKGTITKSRNLSPAEWETITNSFDYSLFLSLDYSDCNVCVDGCDEIIEITEDNTSHELRYSFSDEVEGMENLRQKLQVLLEEMRETD